MDAQKPSPTKPSRKPRSDGQRNRDLLVSVAREAFTKDGAGASLDDIAKKAGVGSGTLYRHFPSREALLEAVFRAEFEKLPEVAEGFVRDLPPADALRAFLLFFVDYLATKKAIAAAINGLEHSEIFAESLSKVQEAVTRVYGTAVEAGVIRPDIDPRDHLRALLGITSFGTREECRKSAPRLVDMLILGSRPP